MPLNKKEGQRLLNTSLTLMRRVIQRYGFLEKNSHVLVGVSGGVDSRVLLLLLTEYNQRFNQRWDIHACHINPQFPKWNTKGLEKFFIQNSIAYTLVATPIYTKVKKISNKCYTCSRERRKKILEIADKLGIFQIAFAHHKQDVVETVLLNMIYNGELSTLVPKQSVIQGRFFFIRPLYYLDKDTIKTIVHIYGLSENTNICPYYRESKREMVRNFLDTIKDENPDVYKNIFRSIFHIKRSYMPF